MNLGVLGGGQLGRMLGLAGIPLGIRFRFLDSDSRAPAAAVGELICGDYTDEHTLRNFASGLDCVTYEFENVPAECVRMLSAILPVHPGGRALETAQDRLSEKQLFARLGIPGPTWMPVDTLPDLPNALGVVGTPAVLKTRRFGYDGKGQWRLGDDAAAAALREELSPDTRGLIAEGFVPFVRELSLISVRSVSGDIVHYPLTQNRHAGGILRESFAPAQNVPSSHEEAAHAYARAILTELNYVGVLTIELFDCGDKLLVNEIAPRVHNSGHWTIEGSATSQFENHLRAVLGLPLGDVTMRGVAAMWNVLGSPPGRSTVLCTPDTHLHLYGKEPRAGRKIGHITVVASDASEIERRLAAVRNAAPQT